MTAAFQAQSAAYLEAIEAYLDAQFRRKDPWGVLYESMRYSLLAGGKRMRPMLSLAFCALHGGRWEDALPLGCAVEMVHTYSLIHDDLPCMDDDDLRRGKPTNHKVYGETMAVLAGDGLQAEAFGLIAAAPALSDRQKIRAVQVLSDACGANGMVAGQVLDMARHESREQLLLLHSLKTGAMIAGAAKMGCIAADADEHAVQCAETYAQKLGLAFQVYDDVLDVVGSEAELGKPIGSDREEGKFTFVDLLGVDGALDYAARCTAEAKDALAGQGDTAFLLELADQLLQRKN